jgi:hypothetical protein
MIVQLGPLQNRGGATTTQALTETSPAIDGGDNALCPDIDQRGVTRPQGIACEIGSYEFAFTPPGFEIFLPVVYH